MLLVRTRLERSSIHGLGVFAAEPIAAGTEVWRFTPGFDLEAHPELLARQPERFREQLLHYGYIDRRLKLFILCCDDARYLNHSETPNIGPDYALERHGVDIALRDIREGEELTVDYRDIEEAR
jgi:SET domain-containing protein